MESISTSLVDIVKVEGDGNCFIRCLSLFIYNDETEHLRSRNEIANYLLANWQKYENINIDTEDGEKNILEYINWMRIPSN